MGLEHDRAARSRMVNKKDLEKEAFDDFMLIICGMRLNLFL